MSSARTRRRWLFVSLAALLFVIAVEGVSFGAWWIRSGAPFTWDAVERSAMAVASGSASHDRLARAAGVSTPPGPAVALHPYLGFVMDPGRADPRVIHELGASIDGLGFLGAERCLAPREPNELRVAIVGGSVASMLGVFGEDALVDALAEVPAFGDRRIRIANLATGAYKQPQQLFSVLWLLTLGGEFDIVINLDGLNEVMLPTGELLEQGVSPFFPWSWSVLADVTSNTELLAAAGKVVWLRGERARAASSLLDSPWRFSPTLALVWSMRDGRRAAELAAANAALAGLPTGIPVELRGPTVPADQRIAACVALWARTSQLLDGVCRTRGARYFHFLQPNQYLAGSKPMSAAERRVAIDPRSRLPALVAEAYPMARDAGARLAADGVRFQDLTLVFASVEEPLYQDTCCHLNRRGNQLLARAIAAAIAADPSLGPPAEPIVVAALTAEPAALHFDTPLANATLRVIGTTATGRPVDVTCTGTRFASSAPQAITVNRFGEVTALAPGRFEITIERDGIVAEVPVVVEFASIRDLGGGARGFRPGGPRLSATLTGEGRLAVRLTEAAGLTSVALCVSAQAEQNSICGGVGWVTPFEVAVVPLVVQGDRAATILTRPGANSPPIYLQAFAADPSHRCGWAISNALAVLGR